MVNEFTRCRRLTYQVSQTGTKVVNLVGHDEWWQVFKNGQVHRLLPLPPEPTLSPWSDVAVIYRDNRTQYLEEGETIFRCESDLLANQVAQAFQELGVTCRIYRRTPQTKGAAE